MIRKLHYVWLGGKPLPANVLSCIKSWKYYLPDWEIIQWNESNFNTIKYRWVREAICSKAYAFAADFIRLHVLKLYGGAYIDTDVQIIRPHIDELLTNGFVGGIENHRFGDKKSFSEILQDGREKDGKVCEWFCLQCGFMYSIPEHPFITECYNLLYDSGNKPFINNDDIDIQNNSFVIDLAMMKVLRKYGVIYLDQTQILNSNITLYKSDIFATRKSKTTNSYLIHWFDQSWLKGTFKRELKRFVKKYLFFLYRLQ